MCSSTLSLTSELNSDGWLRPSPGSFTPGNIRYPLSRKLGGPLDSSELVQKISAHRNLISSLHLPRNPMTVAVLMSATKYTLRTKYCAINNQQVKYNLTEHFGEI